MQVPISDSHYLRKEQRDLFHAFLRKSYFTLEKNSTRTAKKSIAASIAVNEYAVVG